MSLGQQDKSISEIITAKRELVYRLTSGKYFIDWISKILEKYILEEFYAVFYTGDEKHSRSTGGVEKL